ncbi:MAG: hypothetical protein ACMVO5_08950 [Polymorphobacter sp.]|uniref:hypothetical protein n=1 Tax=Polymorphobacter sp. TaxID=1909290 RepID=UPI003A85BB70
MNRIALATVFASMALLVACGEQRPPDREATEGGAARAEMDAATEAFADCIDGHATSMDVAEEAAGSLAIQAVKMCSAERAALVEKVAAFNAIGYPSRTPEQVQAVAEASVKVLEDEARNAAVVTIVKRQNANGEPQAESES